MAKTRPAPDGCTCSRDLCKIFGLHPADACFCDELDPRVIEGGGRCDNCELADDAAAELAASREECESGGTVGSL